MINIQAAIKQLQFEASCIDEAIAAIEKLQQRIAGAKPVERRGRKSMSIAERNEVSKRMRRYWANRRHKNANV
jgi:hypothetical protein